MFYAASAVLLRRATILRRTRGSLRAGSLIVCARHQWRHHHRSDGHVSRRQGRTRRRRDEDGRSVPHDGLRAVRPRLVRGVRWRGGAATRQGEAATLIPLEYGAVERRDETRSSRGEEQLIGTLTKTF